MNKSSIAYVLFLLTFLSFGCSTISVYSHSEKNLEKFKIQKVGVLPFANESEKWRASEIVTNIFIAELFKAGLFKVEEKGNIERFLIREKIKDANDIDMEQLHKFGKILHLDAILKGTVEEFAGGDVGERLPTPIVSIRVRLIDIKSGRIVWMSKHRRRGDDYIKVFDFGRIRSVGALTKLMVSETIKTMGMKSPVKKL